MLLEVFRYEPTVAMVRFFLAAQEAAFGQHVSRNGLFNASLVHQGEESSLECIPISAPLLVLVYHLLSRCQPGKVNVDDPADFPKEVGEVVFLCEPRQLRDIVQPRIDHALGARVPQQLEKATRGLLRESDREHSHGGCPGASTISPACVSSQS
jgi:hypothetical protein